MADRIRVTDVAPRDGLQSEPLSADGAPVSTADKLRLIERLVSSGVDEIELTSFVHPKWVPQLADGAELLDCVAERYAGMRPGTDRPVFSVLIPNERGMVRLLEANQRAVDRHGVPIVDRIALFTAASETFSQKNTNASIGQTLQRFSPVLDMAHEATLGVRGYVSCVIACPFEGPISPQRVADSSLALWELGKERGLDEIDLGDTIGRGTANTTRAMLVAVQRALPKNARLTLHLHDTFGNASACVRSALDMGIRSFDSAAGGLGGCPYASTPDRPAPGNIDTELLVRTCVDAGYTCGVDLEKLSPASDFAVSLKRTKIQSVSVTADSLVTTERENHVLHVMLDRPSKRNALTPAMLTQLELAIRSATPQDHAILLTGNGPAFCAGFDLTLCKDDDTALAALLSGLSGVVRSMREADQPIVCAVHGAAVAGGCALLGGADIVVSTREAKLGYPVVKLGISPAVSAPFLARSGGFGSTSGARDVLLDPSLTSAELFAQRTGMDISCVEHNDDLLEAAHTIAQSLAQKPPGAMAMTKQWLNELEGAHADAHRGLDVSLSLTDTDEVNELLPRVWAPKTQ